MLMSGLFSVQVAPNLELHGGSECNNTLSCWAVSDSATRWAVERWVTQQLRPTLTTQCPTTICWALSDSATQAHTYHPVPDHNLLSAEWLSNSGPHLPPSARPQFVERWVTPTLSTQCTTVISWFRTSHHLAVKARGQHWDKEKWKYISWGRVLTWEYYAWQ
jgi:hypothetical protein